VGYDAGKKVKGRKIHALVDTEGLPLRVVVHSAAIQDRDGAGLVLDKIRRRFPWLELVWADGGYNAWQVDAAVAKVPLLRMEIVKRSDDMKGFVVLPRRWVVERTFSWFGRNRRLAKDFENLAEILATFVTLASIQPDRFLGCIHARSSGISAGVRTIASIAPTLGPVIGGWITDTLNWHWLFYVNLLPGIAITLLAALLVRIDEPDVKLLKDADYPGIVLMAVALATLEYVLEEGSRWNWFDDATIRTCAWVAAIAGVSFVVRSLTFARPVVDLRALTNRNFAVGCFLSFVTGIGIFSTIYLTPLFLGYVRGFSAWQTGVAIFSTGAASLAGVPVYIFLAKKFDTRWLMMFGLASFGLGMWSYSFITHDWGGDQFLLPQILRGFPQVFAVAPAVTLGLGSLSPERLKYASGLFNMMRNLGGAVGIAVCGAILNARTNFHFDAIASHLTPANGAMQRTVAGMTQRYGAMPGSPEAGHVAALKQLWQLAYRERRPWPMPMLSERSCSRSWSRRCWCRCYVRSPPQGRPRPTPIERLSFAFASAGGVARA
jgi:EmrB/QacA subfamily drug resistance transporter